MSPSLSGGAWRDESLTLRNISPPSWTQVKGMIKGFVGWRILHLTGKLKTKLLPGKEPDPQPETPSAANGKEKQDQSQGSQGVTEPGQLLGGNTSIRTRGGRARLADDVV